MFPKFIFTFDPLSPMFVTLKILFSKVKLQPRKNLNSAAKHSFKI